MIAATSNLLDPHSLKTNDLTQCFWAVMHKATRASDWKEIAHYYKQNPDIDINYAPIEGENQGETILYKAFLHAQFELAATMIDQNPQANFTCSPKSGKSIPLLAANGKQIALFNTILESGQNLDLICGPIQGLTTYWIIANYGWWDQIKLIHEKYPSNLPIDQCPEHEDTHGLTPLWLACNHRRLDIVEEMLILKPESNLESMPLKGKNANKTPLWFLFNTYESEKRTSLIEIFLLFGAKTPSDLPEDLEIFKDKLQKTFHELFSDIKEDSLSQNSFSAFLEKYPQMKEFPKGIVIKKIIERAKEL